MKIEILTPERKINEYEGDEVIVPTLNGVVGIRSGHVPFVAPLKAGEVVVKQGKNDTEHYAVAGGFVEVVANNVRILADSAEHASELNPTIIQEAIKRAQEAKSKATDSHELADAAALIEANLARLKVANRKHARSHTYHPDANTDPE